MSRFLLAGLCLTLFVAGCRSRDHGTSLTTPEELDRFLSEHNVVLLDFSAAWCGPCQAMKPTIRGIEKDYAGRIGVAVIDVDQAPKLAKKYHVSSIPCLFVLQKGRVMSVLRGLKSRDEVEEAIKEAL
ncbi:MAG: thioredoxin family protein [Gemmataceae bacterium]